MRITRLPSMGLALAAMILVNGCAAPAPAPTAIPSPQEVVTAFQTAYNQHNVEGAAAWLTEDVIWSSGLSGNGRKMVRNLFEFQFAINTQLALSDCQVTGSAANQVKCQGLDTDDCLSPKIQGYRTDYTFQVSGGQLARIIGQPNQADVKTFTDLWSLRQSWAQANLPADAGKFTGNWWFTVTDRQPADQPSAGEIGQAVDRVCKGYAAATK